MKFSAVALIAAAAGASAGKVSNVTYTTEVVTAYTTYCPEPTKITHGGKTYTITKATTLTITDCPCTITKPVIKTTAVVCNTCGPAKNTTLVPVNPPTTAPGVITKTGEAPKPTGTNPPKEVPVAGAGKVAALSGAGLAGIVGLAAFVL